MWSTIAKLLMKSGPAIIRGSKFLASGTTKAINLAVPKISMVVKAGGSKLASSASNPKVAKAIASATTVLAKEKLIKAVATDVAFKAAKAGIKKIPVAGKPIVRVMDTIDMVVGIPLV